MASVYSVTQVNTYIKDMFAQDFALRKITVSGEVSNCKYHSSGHIYFTLKDKSAALAAVMFAGYRKGLTFRLQEGQKVLVKGSIEVYERDGRYQLYAQQIDLDGTGDLFARFQKLRDELEEMGMFDGEYKQAIPKYAMRVGIVTAPTGAAVRDIMNIAARRNPYVQLILYPALVQGDGAKDSIARGLRILDGMGLDVIICGRGGGSIEDLWAFNEETVARAVFSCQTPVISAVGHETDVTIADYVADLRAPTPSAAAELAVFDYRQFAEQMEIYQNTLTRSMERRMERMRYQIQQAGLRLRLHHPQRRAHEQRQHLAELHEQMERILQMQITECRHRLALLGGRLHGLSPLQKLGRGYGFITDSDEKRVESVSQLEEGSLLDIRLPDGRVKSRVLHKEELAAFPEAQGAANMPMKGIR